MAVTKYSSADGSAPSLTRVAGSFITLADAVLVSGYGSQSSCGWTKAFSGTNLAVYTAPSALGSFCMFIDDTDTSFTKIRIAEGAVSVTESSGYTVPDIVWGPGSSTATAQFGRIEKVTSSVAATIAVRWTLINNSTKGFYLWIDAKNETASTKPTNAGIYMFVKPDLLCSWSGAFPMFYSFRKETTSITDLVGINNLNVAGNELSSNRYLVNPRGFKGGVVRASFLNMLHFTNNDTYGAANANYGVYTDLITSDMHVTRVPFGIDMESGAFGGFLPGILVPLHNIPINHAATVAGSAPYGSSTFELWSGGNGGSILIDTTDNW